MPPERSKQYYSTAFWRGSRGTVSRFIRENLTADYGCAAKDSTSMNTLSVGMPYCKDLGKFRIRDPVYQKQRMKQVRSRSPFHIIMYRMRSSCVADTAPHAVILPIGRRVCSFDPESWTPFRKIVKNPFTQSPNGPKPNCAPVYVVRNGTSRSIFCSSVSAHSLRLRLAAAARSGRAARA